MTEAQEAVESAAIEQQFHKLACFREIRETANAAPSLPDKGFYSVAIPAPPGVHDAFSYVLHVNRESRSAYLQRDGGFAGVHEIHGPYAFWPCLNEALARMPPPPITLTPASSSL